MPESELLHDSAGRQLVFPELEDAALVRELHVYGRLIATTAAKGSSDAQHIGLGTRMMVRAEQIARSHRKVGRWIIGWLGWLPSCSVTQLFGCAAGWWWVFSQPAGWLVGWLLGCSVHSVLSWDEGCLVGRGRRLFVGWLIDGSMDRRLVGWLVVVCLF